MILLWGVPGDTPLDAVEAALMHHGAEMQLVDQRQSSAVKVDLMVLDGGWAAGTITISDPSVDLSIDLGRVRAAYIRPFETDRVCGLDDASFDDRAYHQSVAVDTALIQWADLTSAHVVNRPAAMAANNSKPYQLALIARFGLAVPDTIVTTDDRFVREFWRAHGRIVYKSVSGVRSIVSSLDNDHLDRLADVSNGPTQFQEYVAGVDVRVHVLGEEVIATEISSDADDYRYASRQGAALEMTPTELPEEIAIRCRTMVSGMGLIVAGVDLRRTPDGQWYGLEVNPSPGFTFYESCTGQPIAEAFAGLLIRLDADRRARAFSRQHPRAQSPLRASA